MKKRIIKNFILTGIFILFANNFILFADEGKKIRSIELMNPEYVRSPRESDNINIDSDSSVGEILRKANYFYATRDFDKAIELLEAALKKTDDKILLGGIYFGLSSNYLEKGIKPYLTDKDKAFYNLSIEFANKSLGYLPDNWQALANLGTVYMNIGEYNQAVFYFLEAQKYLDKDDPNYSSLESHRKIAEYMAERK